MKKKFSFTISRKLIMGFGLLGLVVIATFTYITNILQDNLQRNEEIEELYAPSVNYTNELINMIKDSKLLIINWVHIEPEESSNKSKLRQIHEETFDDIKLKIVSFTNSDNKYHWEDSTINLYLTVTAYIDTMFEEQEYIMDSLDSQMDYVMNFNAQSKKLKDGKVAVLTENILEQLDRILAIHQDNMNSNTQAMNQSFADFQSLLKWVAVILLVVMIIIAFTLSRTLIGPINNIKQIIKKMGNGLLPTIKRMNRSDEIGEMGEALKLLIDNLKETSQFALKIGEGNFESKFTPLSEHDVLGNSLILMRENLIKAEKESELRKTENFQRNWASQGIAEFGELLRNSSENMEELSSKVISKLVRYLDANMGGLYIVNDDKKYDPYLELASFYAYDRHKYINKRINVGENLVGQCYQENETMYLTDLPEDYVHITSGLGGDTPRSLLIVPLKVNEETFGIVELASFKVFEKYQIEFVEKIGETIASTISSVKINMQTSKLLAESHEKSERLAKQEEEVRNNIEKMQAQLDELKQKNIKEIERYDKLKEDFEQKIESFENEKVDLSKDIKIQKNKYENSLLSINNSIGSLEVTPDGNVSFINNKYLKNADIVLSDIENKKLSDFLYSEEDKKQFSDILVELNAGNPYSGMSHYYFNEKHKWFDETFTPIRNIDGEITKIFVISNNLTAYKLEEIDLKRQIDDLKTELEILKNRS